VTAASPAPPFPDPTHADGPLVLIVDDSDKNLKLARDVLRAGGFRTLEASSGAEGLALAAAHLPHVVLLDLELADMDGTEAARMLAQQPLTAHVPVVAVSAHALAGSGNWLRKAGFAGWLEKPISVREFPAQVRSYCTSGSP
jgi:two-component system, cell cycle response regulator DivK